MIRETLLSLAAVSLLGCSASTAVKPFGSSKNEESAQLAAYAATAKLPPDVEARDDLRAAAIVDRKDGTIRIYNFSDKSLTGGDIWVNRSYVQRFDAVPARGYVTLDRSRFYDRSGQSLGGVNSPVESVQVQWDNDVYTLLGPVYK